MKMAGMLVRKFEFNSLGVARGLLIKLLRDATVETDRLRCFHFSGATLKD